MSIEMTNGLVEMSEAEMATVVGGLRSWNQCAPSPLVQPELLPRLLNIARGTLAEFCTTSAGRNLIVYMA